MQQIILLDFHWMQLLQPQWYIENGGLWFILFVVFAETGLFAGFFLPGDSLLFVAGIYSNDIFNGAFGINSNLTFINLLLLGLIIAIAGILGNSVGYWFGKKSGPFLFERKDTFFIRKNIFIKQRIFMINMEVALLSWLDLFRLLELLHPSLRVW
jgi:membrane-associated protein